MAGVEMEMRNMDVGFSSASFFFSAVNSNTLMSGSLFYFTVEILFSIIFLVKGQSCLY